MICKFCGFLAQVKATMASGDALPASVLGAAWRPQHERVIAGIFHPLYVVAFKGSKLVRIYYVPAHMLSAYPSVFKPRAKLSESAQRSGWQGFVYDLREPCHRSRFSRSIQPPRKGRAASRTPGRCSATHY